MKAALVVKFTNPVPGRERAALAYGHELDDFAKKKAGEGLVTQPKWYWSSNGDNMIIVEGEYEKLLELTSDPEVTKLENKGMILMQDFRDELVAVGRDEAVGGYEAALAELHIT